MLTNIGTDNMRWAFYNPDPAIEGGLSTHQEFVDGKPAHTERLIVFEKTKYAYGVVGMTGLWVIKLSVLFFYRRFFSCRVSLIISNTLIGITVLWGIAFTLACAFQCAPVSIMWSNPENSPHGFCPQPQPFYLAMAISDLILDCIIFIVPVPHLYMLQLPLRQKLAAGGIFLLGAIVLAIGIARIIIFQLVMDFSAAEPSKFFSDLTWYTSGTLFWPLAENVVGLLGSCLPTYAPLFRGCLGRKKTDDESSNSTHSTLKVHRKYSQRPLYHQRLDNEEILLRSSAAGGALTNFGHKFSGDHALRSIPRGKIMVSKEFRAGSYFQRD
ncbi:hypothetical protein F5Y02DRAFT_431885 [Annulohypoxylon stygium]|nr:hypothetical protein F5Y02DRAFT_431885 [Annulohypoxylon stygium]